ncbi:MAG: PDZ domain-containing protein [Candidatus Omnitrophica bacterium]|nr:PDZ domain-containing protein [Candidatus Omnitrophota bacterium]
MRLSVKGGVFLFNFAGGLILPSLFLFCADVRADTITLKNGKEIKGLVVEQHADRIILSTKTGEIPVLKKGIKNIAYDEPAQNFMQIGKAYESEKKLREALAYYEKALEVNPSLEEAQAAAQGLRNRLWAFSTEGPRSEVEKQQALYDAWGGGRSFDELIQKERAEEGSALKERLGLSLEKKGDWVRVTAADGKKDAALGGLKKGDRLVSVDGQSLRYLNVDAVTKPLLLPRYTNFLLEFEREVQLAKPEGQKRLSALGLDLKLEYQGIVIRSVKEGSAAARAGLKEKDLVMKVNGEATRYLPLGKAIKMIESSHDSTAVFTVRRTTLLARR